MRPIKLRMAAFGTYLEPVTLDFERDLRGEKLFLIHGATGAGKTTILDAICYALYGETSGKAREAKDMRSKGVDDKVLTEVEFSFALGDKIFQVKRRISYSSNRKDNKYQTQAALFCDGKLIETRDRAVRNKITELLGFNADQFRQVVVLPQGEFKKFLSADADDRQKVLNVLFDSEPYKKIEDAISERAKISAEAVKNLKTHCEDLERQIGGADSNSLPELEKNLLLAQKKVAELKKISDDAQAALTKGKLLANKFGDLSKITAELSDAQKKFDEAHKKFSAAEAEYQRRVAEESERKELERQSRDLDAIKTARKDLKTKSDDLEREKKSLALANATFDKCDGNAKYYEKLIEERKAQKAKVDGADVKFEQAKQSLDRAHQRDKILREIARLEKELDTETAKLAAVAKNLKSAQIEQNRLQIVNSAAYLATKLKDGEPCPVCGSLEHPAIIAEAIPTAAELQRAEEKVSRLTAENTQQEREVAQVKGKIFSQKKSLENYIGVPETAAAQKVFDEWQKKAAELADYQKRIETGESLIRENNSALNKAISAKNSATSKVAKLEGAISEAKKKIPEKYLDDDAQLDADLSAAQKNFAQLDAAWKKADKNFRAASEEKSAREATLKSVQKNFDALQRELKDKTPPDLSALEQKATAANETYGAARDEKAKLETTLNTLKKFSAELDKCKKELAAAEKISDMWRRLSDVANATGKGESELKISFQRYFLSTMFAEVLTEANNRLKKMSNGRYLFQMKDAGKTKAKTAGLNLEILDENSGALRPVETLSGGESFLASLSLALGLAAVVRNKIGGIQLETIFIDEGFGSLDTETLDFAISTITEQSGGRLVGIISHVEELKNQIPVRLEIFKSKTGSYAKFIG
ncbi:MAG: SMC family ATPase [Quinella sp. 3Q1]|nr:SMC family ATPase [Quinella sp. 3Q1]